MQVTCMQLKTADVQQILRMALSKVFKANFVSLRVIITTYELLSLKAQTYGKIHDGFVKAETT